ncbi:MAG TPA: hypothetical protein VJY41_08480 [Prolixibacteraceae bacterium]|jgi:hypothetical protein|nr:hypothetical protein [Prolixibacteraceae bacterium]
MNNQSLTKGTHGTQGETFNELSFDRQSKSINGMIQTLQKAINANVQKGVSEGKNGDEIKLKRIMQVIKMIERLYKE